MRNLHLSEGTVREIDKQVSKILRGLGNPKPPLDVEAVFKLQELDPQFYRTSADGVVRETISRVKVGAKLLFQDPIRIWDALKKADLKALYIPTQRRVLIDATLHEKKIRWNSAHEIGHSILEWHQDYTLGDDQFTVLESFREQIEAEANFAAGRLLFLQDRFTEQVKGQVHTLQGLQEVAKEYGNSWTSTVYRTVDTLDLPSFAVIGSHPQHCPDESVRHLISSPSFTERFSTFKDSDAKSLLRSYCIWKKRGPLGVGEFVLSDVRGDRWKFGIESFGLPQGDVLTLAQSTGKVAKAFATHGG